MTAADRPSVTDTTGVQVGDADPWTGAYEICNTRLESSAHLICTAPLGHTGPHVAADPSSVVAVDPDRPSVTDDARADLHPVVTEHQIVGTQTGKQGAGQVVPEDSVLCVKCGWMRCSDYTWHLSDALAADRPSVTDNARAEAERRYPSDVADRGLTYPTGAVREHSQAAFVAGAEWAAGRAETTTEAVERIARQIARETAMTGRDALELVEAVQALQDAETTTTTDEDAARVIDALGRHWWSTQTGETEPWDDLTDDEKANVIENAYIDVLATPVLGLLATARTRPTREAIEEAIEAGKVAHDDAVAAGGAVGPQNDYIAEEVDALLNHDQPTEAEAGARALVHAAGDHFRAMVAAGAGNPGEVSTWLRERAARLRGGDHRG